jgi:hypothetical protein
VKEQERLIPWTRPGWFEQVSFWVHVELERWGIEVRDPIEQPHSRPWSTVLRVPTGEGDIYFKAVSPVHPYEPALLGSCAASDPGDSGALGREFRMEIVGGAWPEFPVTYASIIDAVPEGA